MAYRGTWVSSVGSWPVEISGGRLGKEWLRPIPDPQLTEVLRRVIDLPGRGLTRPLAESILALDFPENAAERITELSGKANEGALTETEEAEFEAYIHVGDLLALWQSKAATTL